VVNERGRELLFCILKLDWKGLEDRFYRLLAGVYEQKDVFFLFFMVFKFCDEAYFD
jgi:hypothetical protein